VLHKQISDDRTYLSAKFREKTLILLSSKYSNNKSKCTKHYSQYNGISENYNEYKCTNGQKHSYIKNGIFLQGFRKTAMSRRNNPFSS
jgi:hypothetical protein